MVYDVNIGYYWPDILGFSGSDHQAGPSACFCVSIGYGFVEGGRLHVVRPAVKWYVTVGCASGVWLSS